LIIIHFAPAIESSSKGLSIAARDASTALLSQDPYQIQIKALPAFLIIDFKSLKSRFINHGLVIKSEIH
jgi:hypothetical protein